MISRAKRIIRGYIRKNLDALLRFKSFQDYVNNRFYRDGYIIVAERFLQGVYYSYAGFKFHFCDQLYTIDQAINDYCYSDINSSDVVLDIGANIGGFSLLASKRAKQVYAVEPVYADILRKNIVLNRITNIKVLEAGLGIGTHDVTFDLDECKRRKKRVDLKTLSEILEMVGKCDFLKIDCEGCEWFIDYRELEGFRRIEGEVHNFDGKHNFTSFEGILAKAGFKYEVVRNSEQTYLIHAFKRI